jgi:hypothetical protein
MRKALLAALVLPLLALSTPAAAHSPIPDPPPYHKVTWAALKAEIAKHHIVVGPNRYTGYGKLVITKMVRVTAGKYKGKFKPVFKVYNVGDPRKTMTATRHLDTCWPWESGTIFGCSSPFDPGTWDWDALFNLVKKKTQEASPLKPVTLNNQEKCAKGMIPAASFATVTKTGVGNILGFKDYVRVTPEGYAMGVLSGCLVSLWW